MKKLYLNPKPRLINTLLKSKTIFFYIEANGTRFVDLKISYILFAVFEGNGDEFYFLFNNFKFYSQKSLLFKQWLSDPENTLIFFHYGFSLIPFLQRIRFTNYTARCIDLYLLCKRLNNDFESIHLKDWICKIFNIEAVDFPEAPNWESRELPALVIKTMQTMNLLYQHLEESQYHWMNTYSGQKVELFQYYYCYDAPLIRPILQRCIQGFRIDLNVYQKIKTETTVQLENLSQEFKKTFHQKWEQSIFESYKKFEQYLEPDSWELGFKYPRTREKRAVISYLKLQAFRDKNKIQNKKLDLIIDIIQYIKRSQQLQQFKVDNPLLVNLNLIGTRTGRLSTSEPNLQGLPHFLRKIIVPKRGKVFLKMDLNQAELRIMAHITQDPEMGRIYASEGDIHSFTAAKLLQMSEEKFGQLKKKDPETYQINRQIGKTSNFGLLFGMETPGLMKLLEKSGIYLDYQKSQKIYKTWHDTYTSISLYHEKEVDKYNANQKGDIFQTYTSETQFKNYHTSLGGMKNMYEKHQKTNLKSIVNFPTQASCSEILKLIWIKSLEYENWGEVLLTLHDELLVECTPEQTENTQKLFEKILKEVNKEIMPSIPLFFEFQVLKRWE